MNTLKVITLVLIGLLCGAGIIFYAMWLRDNLLAKQAPYVKVPADILPEIIDLIRADKSAVLYDLGCGDGRVLIASERSAQHSCVGIERGIVPYLRCKWLTRKQAGAQVIRADMFRTPLHEASHIFLYLHDSLMQKLEPKLRQELKPGTVVVSCDFVFPNIKPAKTISVTSRHGIKPTYKLYKYVF